MRHCKKTLSKPIKHLMKTFIKKHFKDFTYFYQQVGIKIFIMLVLSLFVSILDGFGLSMFMPLLQMVGGDASIDAEQMGNLRFLVDGAESLGISLTLASILSIMIVFFVFKGLASYLNDLFNVILQQKFIKKIRKDVLNALNKVSFKYFINSDVGKIQNTMSGEVDRVALAFRFYFRAFQQGAMVAVYLGFAFVVNAQFAFLVAVGGALTNFLYRVIYKYTKGESRKFTSSSHVYQGLIIQHVANFKYLRATGMVPKHSKKLKSSIDEIEVARRKIGILDGIGNAAREPLLIIVVAAVILIQTQVLGGSMSAILISLLFFYRALASLVAMQQNWNYFIGFSGSLENVRSFEKELHAAQENKREIKFENFKREISLQNINFYYGETPILKGIDLKIKKNESLAFVGESGSGKTTLVNLIAALLDTDEGEIHIDGSPLNIYQKESYQKRIGYITQEAVIFNDTIFNNITFWDEPTEENKKRFEKAITQAAIESFIQELPLKEQTELGNNGINLSGGQKQRISIARELYKDIDILIMDEATSALDSETEKVIQESIEALQGQYTLLIVAHRLSTIKNVDRVVFMHQGIIEMEGNFNQLVEELPAFKKMVDMQEL